MLLSVLLLFNSWTLISGLKSHIVYWNSTNPLFRIDNTEHVIDVNQENLPWEYDQLNIICPLGTSERHIIYSVTKEEFDSCRVSNPRPKIVAVCDRPERFKYFTITFRSFSPTPGGLEFKPGQSYYFVSTSNTKDLHRRVGGFCSTHNMKMVFNVGHRQTDLNNHMDSRHKSQQYDLLGGSSSAKTPVINSPIYRAVILSTTSRPGSVVYHYKPSTATVRTSDYLYYYSPRDLIQLKMAAKKHLNYSRKENESIRPEKLTSGADVRIPNGLIVFAVVLSSVLQTLC